MKKIPLLYILSSGHSGTTLLDLLLGAHPHVWTLGEAQLLPWELKHPKNPCGDGQPVAKSEFWRGLLEDIPTEPKGYHIGYFRDERQLGNVLRADVLPDLWRGTVSPASRPAVREYADNNATLFRVVRAAAQKRSGHSIHWLVDNSKDPYRLFWLHRSERFDIRVVHLMKDPRAFVYSMTKDRLPYATSKVIRFAGRWIVENSVMARLCRNSFADENVRRLSYEQLAEAPAETLADLGAWLGIDYPASLTREFRAYENFAISGNAMRWREREDEIRLDEKWKSRLPWPYPEVVKGVTRPFATYCGYPRTIT